MNRGKPPAGSPSIGERRARPGQASGDVIVLTDGDIQVTLTPRDATKPLDPEEDSQELEAELLRAIDGPYRPYSEDEFRAIGQRIVREQRKP